MKKLKTIYAGALQLRALYDRAERRDPPKERAAKQKASSAAQQRMNQINSALKLELLLACNFPTPGSAVVVTLTCDDKHVKASRAQMQRATKSFLTKLRAARRDSGLPEPRAIWAPEALSSASGRWHVHMALDATGRDAEQIRRCWIYGEVVEIEKLRVDKKKNHESLARYLSKESREVQDYSAKPGLHGWSCTRNVRRPEVDVQTVPDDYRLETPEGAVVLLDEGRSTEYASWRVQKLRLPRAAFPRRPRARRRRRC